MRWQFDNCSLDVERRELRRAGAVVAVEPQVFDLLVHLIRNRGRVVSKGDLLECVWQGRIVSDSALANRINAARTAVGDSGDGQKIIRTLPRKGFRFVGEVAEETIDTVVPQSRTRVIAAQTGPARPALHCCAAIHGYEPEAERGAFRRRDHGGPDHGVGAHSVAVRDRPQLGFRLQGQGRRCETSLP